MEKYILLPSRANFTGLLYLKIDVDILIKISFDFFLSNYPSYIIHFFPTGPIAFTKKLFSSFSTSLQFVNKELFSSSARFILSGRYIYIFFDKKGLLVLQKRSLSAMFSCLGLRNKSFQIFEAVKRFYFFALQNSFLFTLLLFFKKRFINLLFPMIALEISLLMKGLWLYCIYNFLLGACLSKIPV